MTSWAPAAPTTSRYQRRVRSPHPPALVGCAQGRLGISGGPKLEHADPEPPRDLRFPGRHLLLASLRRELHGGLDLDRQPGMRVLYHAGNTVTLGFSAENPDPYMGGYSGGGGHHPARGLDQLVQHPAGPGRHRPRIVHAHPRLHRQDCMGSQLTLPRRSRRRRAQPQDRESEHRVVSANTAPRWAAAFWSA